MRSTPTFRSNRPEFQGNQVPLDIEQEVWKWGKSGEISVSTLVVLTSIYPLGYLDRLWPLPAVPTLHSSEVQADAEVVEGDHEGELEVDLSVVAQKVEEAVVVRIGELQLVKNLVEDS